MAFGNGLEQHKSQHSHAMRLAALVGVGALGLFLLLRGRGTTAAGGISSAQEQQDIANALAQQQAPGTPSTFADNGAQAAGLADAVTQGLGGVQDALTNFTAAQQASAATGGSTPTTAAPPDAVGVAAVGALGSALTQALANNGQKSSGGSAPSASPNGRPAVGAPAGPHGAVVAPYGGTKPPDKPGFSTVGTGKGGWIYVPNKRQQVANHGGGQKQAGGQKQNTHTRK